MRMSDDILPKKIINSRIGGIKRRGRPEARWNNEVIKDIEQMHNRK